MIYQISFRANVDGVTYVNAENEDEALEKFIEDKFAYIVEGVIDGGAHIEVPFYETT